MASEHSSAYRTPELTAEIEAQARRFNVPPEAIVAVAGVEGSGFNPRYKTEDQYGIFQMAEDDFRTGGGTLGGLTFDQYRNAATLRSKPPLTVTTSAPLRIRPLSITPQARVIPRSRQPCCRASSSRRVNEVGGRACRR